MTLGNLASNMRVQLYSTNLMDSPSVGCIEPQGPVWRPTRVLKAQCLGFIKCIAPEVLSSLVCAAWCCALNP